MRRILLEVPNHRAWKRWIKACDAETKRLQAAVGAGSAIAFRQKLYARKSIRRFYFFASEAPFYGKCAYCECALELVDGDVDHFRPKAIYYWLAYYWKNLLPCCKTCNQFFKGAQFPVEGERATCEAELALEKPLLLDPASEDPAAEPGKHLTVDDTGMIAGKSLQGKTTIEVLGLDRDALQRARRGAYLEAEALLARVRRGEAKALEDLQAIAEGRRPYFLAQKAALAKRAARAGL